VVGTAVLERLQHFTSAAERFPCPGLVARGGQHLGQPAERLEPVRSLAEFVRGVGGQLVLFHRPGDATHDGQIAGDSHPQRGIFVAVLDQGVEIKRPLQDLGRLVVPSEPAQRLPLAVEAADLRPAVADILVQFNGTLAILERQVVAVQCRVHAMQVDVDDRLLGRQVMIGKDRARRFQQLDRLLAGAEEPPGAGQQPQHVPLTDPVAAVAGGS
jgi:hypothetical protein